MRLIVKDGHYELILAVLTIRDGLKLNSVKLLNRKKVFIVLENILCR